MRSADGEISVSGPVTWDEMMFFNERPEAFRLYEAFREGVRERTPGARIGVKKTQISFFSRYLFAAVSFAPVRRAKERPDPFLTVSFGLPYRKVSARIDAAAEAYPGRWTHHVTIGKEEEIDGELLSWITEAAEFAERK